MINKNKLYKLILIIVNILFLLNSNLLAKTSKIKINEIGKYNYNGEVLILEVKNAFNPEFIGKYKQYKFYKKKFINNKKNKETIYYAILPISYYYKKKYMYFALAYNKQKDKTKKIYYKNYKTKIKQRNYKKEIIITKKRKKEKKKKHSKRIQKEYFDAIKIYKTIGKKALWSKKFILPLKSKKTSKFGNNRIYNKKTRGFHTGVDFRAKMNTEIISSNDGIVVIANDRFYAGKSVVIDHGQGVYSCYYHLNKILVKKDDKIKRGQLLGLSGKTGRVTGAHLHFAIKVNAHNINPLNFIYKINKLLKN
jgi:murein DD-endopeptidase MepM/ murein hydrolase activator NlpD